MVLVGGVEGEEKDTTPHHSPLTPTERISVGCWWWWVALRTNGHFAQRMPHGRPVLVISLPGQ